MTLSRAMGPNKDGKDGRVASPTGSSSLRSPEALRASALTGDDPSRVRKFRVLSLFAGIGGFDLGLERTGGFETVAFCEIDPFCRRVLAKHWPEVPCYDDVRILTADRLRADGVEPDCIVGGFPCQDVSENGPKTGMSGAKSGLWSEYDRLIGELRPRLVIVENVTGLLYRGLGLVLGDLAQRGYDAQWRAVPASTVGLPQTRDRVWIVAYPDCCGFEAGDERQSPGPLYFRWADNDRLGEAQARAHACAGGAFGRDDGLPRWVDRTRALGNAVVPQIPELIGRAILAAEDSRAMGHPPARAETGTGSVHGWPGAAQRQAPKDIR